ncbi:hypothetical protein C9I56_40160 [Paraburkholderia caribensis]|nr:hypothetical protein C9I56_40160 [Paraburkholderia caribensis]
MDTILPSALPDFKMSCRAAYHQPTRRRERQMQGFRERDAHSSFLELRSYPTALCFAATLGGNAGRHRTELKARLLA